MLLLFRFATGIVVVANVAVALVVVVFSCACCCRCAIVIVFSFLRQLRNKLREAGGQVTMLELLR